MKQKTKILKMLTAIVMALSFILITSDNVYAADLKNNSAFMFKLSDPKSKFNNGATVSSHKKAFDTDFSKINATSSKINLVRSGNGPTIRTRSTNSKESWYGLMEGGAKGSLLSINIRTTSKDKFSQANYNKTALHEMGHALGLKHQSSSTNSLMKQGKYSYGDYTSLDKNNLKYKYGK
ncbi:matrixin family metalloprotease [Listeria ivanovii subsp. ivanovii]